ncbi:hypothetical protein J6590_096033, partial [Homalodisca vitripennis]
MRAKDFEKRALKAETAISGPKTSKKEANFIMAKSLGEPMPQHALLMRAVAVDTTDMQLSGLVRPADHSWLSNQLSPQGHNGTGMKRRERLPTAIGLLDSIGVVSLSSCLCSIALLAGIGLMTRTDDVSMSRCHCCIAPVTGIGLINSTKEVSMSKCHCSIAPLAGMGLINRTDDVSMSRFPCTAALFGKLCHPMGRSSPICRLVAWSVCLFEKKNFLWMPSMHYALNLVS